MDANDRPRAAIGGAGLVRRWAARFHLWLGLPSALLLSFVCFTGGLVVFSDEIIDLAARDALHVQVGSHRVPFESLLSTVRGRFPDQRVAYAVVHRDPDRSVKFLLAHRERGLTNAYVDPWTGRILSVDRTIQVFYVLAHLHGSLLVHGAGEWVVGIATLVFLAELATGAWLWMPRRWSRGALRRSLVPRLSGGFRKISRDLHVVVGFLALPVLLVLSLTGAILCFSPLSDLLVRALGGTDQRAWETSIPGLEPGRNPAPLDPVLRRQLGSAETRAVQVPLWIGDSAGVRPLLAARRIHLKSAAGARLEAVDPRDGSPVAVPPEVKRGAAIENWLWRLHMGVWLGAAGKILSFLAALVGTLLPPTGILLWWWRTAPRRRTRTQS